MSVSATSPCCAPCAEAAVRPTDPAEILARLPAALFSRRGPVAPEVAQFDVQLDETQFGPVGGEEPTPQWELARLFAAQRDELLRAWRRTVANTFGLGRLDAVNGEVHSECPHAAGADLDRVGEQYGISRPTGFTDCCYWRLIVLLLFQAGSTRWLISELARLYTGRAPKLVEEPAKLLLSWPVNGGRGFYGPRTLAGGGWYFGVNSYLNGDGPAPIATHRRHGYWLAGGASDPHPRSHWGRGRVRSTTGLTLRAAIALVKAAGVAVVYSNEPRPGLTGCYGATLRRPAGAGAVWA